MKIKAACLSAIFAALWCSAAYSQTAAVQFGPFAIDPEKPDLALLLGPIEPGTPLDFRRLIRAYPEVKTLALASEGGDVTGALLVAQEVATIGINTYVPKDTGCYSACSFIFFAGEDRAVLGELGVHQVSGRTDNDYSTQIAVADILDTLTEFGVPPTVFADLLRTPPNSMKVYSPEDAARLGINRSLSAIATGDLPLPADAQPALTPTPAAPHRGPLISTLETTPIPQGGVQWVNAIYQMHEPAKLDDFLLEVGLRQTDFTGFTPLLEKRLKSDILPTWSTVSILTWPYEAQPGQKPEPVAAQVSVYTPEPPDGRITHRITVQMNDKGLFWEVPEPKAQ